MKDAVAEIKDLRAELRAAEQRQRADLTASEQRHRTELTAVREKLEGSLGVFRSHLIALTQKVEKRNLTPGEVKELLSSVRDVSKFEASLLSEHRPVRGDPLPQMPPPVYDLLTQSRKDEGIASIFLLGQPKNDVGLETALARSLLAKNGAWHAEDNGLRFTYDGGTSFFRAKPPTSHRDLEKQAELLNSVSQVVAQTIGDANAWKAQKYKPKPNVQHGIGGGAP